MPSSEQQSIDLLLSVLEPKNHSFKIVRSKFQKLIDDNDELLEMWYEDGEFRTMKLYNMIVNLGYRKSQHVLKKLKASKYQSQ